MGQSLRESVTKNKIRLTPTEKRKLSSIENIVSKSTLQKDIVSILFNSKIIKEKNNIKKKEKKLLSEFKKTETELKIRKGKILDDDEENLIDKQIIIDNQLKSLKKNKKREEGEKVKEFLDEFSDKKKLERHCLRFYNNLRILRLDKISQLIKSIPIDNEMHYDDIRRLLIQVIKNIEDTYEEGTLERSIFSELCVNVQEFDLDKIVKFFEETGKEMKDFEREMRNQKLQREFKKDFFVKNLE